MQVALREEAPQQRAADGAGAEDEDLNRVRVLGGQSEGRAELVLCGRQNNGSSFVWSTHMQLVNALVERRRVQSTVSPVRSSATLNGHAGARDAPVMEEVLEDEEEGDLPSVSCARKEAGA